MVSNWTGAMPNIEIVENNWNNQRLVKAFEVGKEAFKTCKRGMFIQEIWLSELSLSIKTSSLLLPTPYGSMQETTKWN